MSEGWFFNKCIPNPVKRFYHEYIFRETDWPDERQNKASDAYEHIQESSGFYLSR